METRRTGEGLQVSWVGISGCVRTTCFALGIALLVYGRCLSLRLAVVCGNGIIITVMRGMLHWK